MPTYQFEAIDAATGKEIRDTVDAASEAEAQATIRSMGYMVTKLKAKKAKAVATSSGGRKPGRTFAIGGVKSKDLTLFTRQLSILQDAGLPILRSLKLLANMQKAGRLKNSLLDVCDEIEGGATLSEAMSKSPKAFDRLYCNMIRAGEAGGALVVILRRLAEFMEWSESLKRKVKGALVYPIVVVSVAVAILTFIMLKIFRSIQPYESLQALSASLRGCLRPWESLQMPAFTVSAFIDALGRMWPFMFRRPLLCCPGFLVR